MIGNLLKYHSIITQKRKTVNITQTKIITKYLADRLSAEEKTYFDAKYAEDADFRQEVEDYTIIWKQAELLKQQKQYRTEANWQQVSKRIGRNTLRLQFWNIVRTTAAVLLLPLLAVTVYLATQKSPAETEEMISIHAAYGQVSRVLLPDSSQVWLNSGSTLTYPRVFDANTRQVTLSGEAYFNVKANAKHRFEVVIPQLMQVSAYGTEFNISAYQEDGVVETVLVQGNVELLSAKRRLAHLSVGESAVMERSGGGKPLITQVNIDEKVGWKDGKLIFRRAGIEEITKRLARHFGVEFELMDDRLRAYEFSATFTTESLSEILSLLDKASPINAQVIEPRKLDDCSYLRRKVILSIDP